LHKCCFIAHCTGSGGSNFPDSSLSEPKFQIQGKYQGLEIQKFFHIQLFFLLKWQWGWKSSLTKKGTRGMEPFFKKEHQERNGTGRPFFYSERNGTGWNGTIKKEQERNDFIAEGPRSRTECNNFKKFGTCPALHYNFIKNSAKMYSKK